MTQTLTTIQRKLEKPQKEAAVVKAKGVASLTDRIRETIAHYASSPDDLFTAMKSTRLMP